ncbi:membrane integrity-associated transporter subunit PqiC [Arsukibacterium sp.]|uniref:PqiC family protein n=1 Tax=Arsukibacterium sp. TaxID=1977258 RepID=UPI0035662B80
MKLVLTMLLVGGLVACSSPPPVSYYQLSAPPPVLNPDQRQMPQYSLHLQPVMVANYLNGAGLVMQRSEVELVIASRHLWADALDQQMYRLLAEQLQARMPALQLSPVSIAADIRLQLTVDRFHAQDDGMAVITGFYTLISGDKRASHSFSYRQPLTADGYPAMVSALSKGWQQLVDDLIAQLSQQHL